MSRVASGGLCLPVYLPHESICVAKVCSKKCTVVITTRDCARVKVIGFVVVIVVVVVTQNLANLNI